MQRPAGALTRPPNKRPAVHLLGLAVPVDCGQSPSREGAALLASRRAMKTTAASRTGVRPTRWRALLASLAVLPALVACVHYEHTETFSPAPYVYSNMPQCRVRELALDRPTVALFIGVSGYGPQAGVYSTAAHFIGASLLSGLFGRAGDRAGPLMYESTTLTDILPRSQMPEGVVNPMNVVDNMGYGSGGTAEPVRRARIQQALADTIAKAEKTVDSQGRVQLVIYIAAHGFLGPDGQPYFLPGDAVATDLSTWISYRSVLDSVQTFLGRNGSGPQARTAVVIFDTCQIRRGGAPAKAATLSPAPGLTLVQSAAPGQYAWHWTGMNTITNRPPGFGLDPLHEPGFQMRTITATMSVLPLANQCALADTVKASDLKPGAPDQPIPVDAWFAALKRKADGYLAQIPEMKALSRDQEISITVAPGEAGRPLFLMKAPEAAPDSPPKER